MILLIIIIELMFKQIIHKRLQTKPKILNMLIVLCASLAVVYISSESGVFYRKPNMFEILDISPDAPPSEIKKRVDEMFPEKDKDYDIFNMLTTKSNREQYIKFGKIDISVVQNSFDVRTFNYFPNYVVMLLICMTFCAENYLSF